MIKFVFMVESLENTKNYKETTILSKILQRNGHILVYYYKKMLSENMIGS